MATVFTSNLRLALPTTGAESGTWGTTVNDGITTLVDTAITGLASLSMTTADYTLSTANGATDEARCMFLTIGGTPGAARNIIVPALSKLYIVYNNSTGGYAQTVKTSAGTGISVPNGSRAVLYCDGTNVVSAETYLSALTLGTALPVASGGTGASTLTANYALLGNGASAPQMIAPGTSGNVLTSNGTTWSSTAPAAGISLSGTNTWTGAQTFTNSLMKLLGSSTGATTFTSANAGASNYTITIPGVTDTLAVLGANTFTATQIHGDNQVTRAMLIDCGNTSVAKGNSGTSTQTYDYTAGSVQTSTATGNHTLATSNWPPTGNLGVILILLTNGGAYTLTMPTLNWSQPSGVVTTSFSTYLASLTGRSALQPSGTDQILWWSLAAGTTIYGKLV